MNEESKPTDSRPAMNIVYSFLKPRRAKWLAFAAVVAVFGWAGIASAPSEFPINEPVSIPKGASLDDIADSLKKRGIIRSSTLFKLITRVTRNERDLVAGEYYFDRPYSLVGIFSRIAKGALGTATVKVTIPEGSNVFDVADILQGKLNNFNTVLFLRLARSREGFLFPDTYFISQSATPAEVIGLMERTFEKRVMSAEQAIRQSGKSLKEIVIMASILEEEARTTESRRTIAGILWKRLSIGMPLQVDAAFLYINGKNTYQLTVDDLAIDSPYNTYKYAGLPPGPITNPGLDSIIAAATPVKSKYLYYLSDRKGAIYYAATFEEHKVNKEKYL